ncbi:MAG: ATP-dependent DNA helicase RecQ [Myxococcales bacterium]|nr:ATP-dependent DNA helicase RecQ [Myxococcales bacterium]
MTVVPLPDATPGALEHALATVFGFATLRPGQAEVIADVLEGRPVIAVMPTGAGKSLCYQLPAVVLGAAGGVTLVVSPLIALMKDQVDALVARGVAAVALTSAASSEQQRDILDGLRVGAFSIIFVAPERFKSPRFVDALRDCGDRLALLAIDEAHCISEWGHDFRPDYRRLGDAVRSLHPPRLAAFTATATPEVRADIAVQLDMAAPRFHVRGFDRPNLTYEVERVRGIDDKSQRITQLARTRDSGVALVYAATRKNAEKYAETLKRAGMRVRVYHAGLDDRTRDEAQDTFMANKLDAVVATNAFGMGIDKADIRVVVHADIPRSPEAYYQECGRGGRDGRPTRCVLLFGAGDVRLQEFLIDASYPSADVLRALWKLLRDEPSLGTGDAEDRLGKRLPGEPHASTVGAALRILERHGLLAADGNGWSAVRPDPGSYPPLDVEALARRAEVERSKLRAMIDYAWSARCRRQMILEYFGDEDWADPARRCGSCDVCDAAARGDANLDDGTRAAVVGVLELVGVLRGRFGRTRVASLAAGGDDDERFAELPERGCLRGWSQRDVLDLLRTLEGGALIEASRGEYPTVALTKRGEQVVAGTLDVDSLGLRVTAPSARARKPRGPRKRRREP